MRSRLLLLAPVLTLAACDYGAVPLGGDETDGFVIADSAATAHLGAAIEGGDDMTFRELFERGDGIVFADKPDPTDLLRDTNVLDDDRPRAGRVPLSLFTWNVALLDVDLLGFIPYAETPDLDRRRRVLPGLVFSTGADIILLQEVWLDEDLEEFLRDGEAAGYRGFAQDRHGHNDGLVTFIRDDIIQGGTSTDFAFGAYAAQTVTEYFPGPGIQRGWNSVRFIHRELGAIRVFNTHMQAFPESWLHRAKQSRELGILMRTSPTNDGDEDELVFAGGDFNSGPYYKDSTWKAPDGREQDRWFHNTISYPVLLTYAEAVDLAIMGRPAADAIADVTLGDTVINDAAKALDVPGADDGWCGRTPKTTFTATDCNSLYFDQYAGTEYPARLDHLFVRDPAGRVVVANSRLMFTEKQAFGDIEREPSDHYGVLVDLVVAPR